MFKQHFSFHFARLFPWETPDGSARQRRRQNYRNSNESSIQKTDDIFSDSTIREEDRKTSAGVPVSHSTPVGSSGTTGERSETRKNPAVVAAVSDFIIDFVSNCSLAGIEKMRTIQKSCSTIICCLNIEKAIDISTLKFVELSQRS